MNEFNFKDAKSKKSFQKSNKQNKSKNNFKKSHKGYKTKDSFDISKTKIPRDTREILKGFDVNKFDNFYLKLNKYARFDLTDIKKPNEEKFIFYRRGAKDLDNIEIKVNFGDFKFKENIEAQEQIAKNLFDKNIYKNFLKTTYRLKIGGEESIYEVTFKLHHIYGIPYIPASAIKGVVRSYLIEKFFYKELKEYKDNYSKFENEVLFKDDDFKYYFGTQEQEGKIIFFDAFPIAEPKIKIDIMNPHYGHYYNEGKAPTDTNNPVPINFLTVENAEFQFIIGSKEEIDESFKKLFKEALENHGIGGKTAVGYGYFEKDKKYENNPNSS